VGPRDAGRSDAGPVWRTRFNALARRQRHQDFASTDRRRGACRVLRRRFASLPSIRGLDACTSRISMIFSIAILSL
jgi:hypothetical protein